MRAFKGQLLITFKVCIPNVATEIVKYDEVRKTDIFILLSMFGEMFK